MLKLVSFQFRTKFTRKHFKRNELVNRKSQSLDKRINSPSSLNGLSSPSLSATISSQLSTFPAKLWFQHLESDPYEVRITPETENMSNIITFIRKDDDIRQQLQIPKDCGSLTLFHNGTALDVGLTLQDLTSQEGFINDSKHPIIVETHIVRTQREVSPDSIINSIIDPLKLNNIHLKNSLVRSTGHDFVFSDRDSSLEILALSINNRYLAWQCRYQDRNLHPIPFLADGPGTGKSRFLEELPIALKNHVVNSEKMNPECVSSVKNALFINITFGNGTIYHPDEVTYSIEKSICLRILFLYQSKFQVFRDFCQSNQSFTNLTLNFVLKKISQNYPCIVLGIDEVNQVHDVDKLRFKEMFRIIGERSCFFDPFLVSIFAGTTINSMNYIISESFHPPLHIPLPLISFKSCMEIIKTKNSELAVLISSNRKLKILISDIGGHCRALEFLYEGFQTLNKDSTSYSDDLFSYTIQKIKERYKFSNLGAAIAYSILSLEVLNDVKYPDDTNQTFFDLGASGTIKLVDGKVQIPFVFSCAYLKSNQSNIKFSQFWKEVFLDSEFRWESWEVFNQYFIALRLSLFAHLNYKTVTLKELFRGGIISVSTNLVIKIPENIKCTNIKERYPTTAAPEFEYGNSVLNASGAPFDSFIFLEEAITGRKILFAFQAKLANTKKGQKITDAMIRNEHEKIMRVSRYFPDALCVCVLVSRCESNFDANCLPENLIVISEDEQERFYGQSFYRRMNVY